MFLPFPITIIFGVLLLLLIVRFLKNQHKPCALGFADVPVEILIIRRLHGTAWVLHWENFQGWGYEFDRNTSDDRQCRDRVVMEFTNISVEIHGRNLKPIKEGVVAHTLNLLQEVTDEEVRILNKRGEPVIRKIEVIPASVTELQVK